MLKQLIGKNGEIVGSEGYFKKINKNTFLGSLTEDESGINYSYSVKKLPVMGVIGEISADLREKTKIIDYIPVKNKERLIDFLKNLRELTTDMSIEYCIGILEKEVDYQYIYKLDAKIQKIKKGGRYEVTEADGIQFFRDIIAEGGIHNVGPGSKFYLADIFGGEDDSIIWHMITRYDFLRGALDYKGKCGFGIGSEAYIYYLEKKLFGEKGHNFLKENKKSGSYKAIINESRDKIAGIIYDDLKTGEVEKDYIGEAEARILKSAVEELSKMGILTAGKMSKLIDRLIENMAKLKELMENLKKYAHPVLMDNLDELLDYCEMYNPTGDTALNIILIKNLNKHIEAFGKNPNVKEIIEIAKKVPKPNVNEWTADDILEWKILKKDIFEFKYQWVKGYKDIIKTAAATYDLPPELVAGIAMLEVGGAPLWWDDLTYAGRDNGIVKYLAEKSWIPNSDKVNQNKYETSFGNVSMKIRVAASLLGYDYDKISKTRQKLIIDMLKDVNTNVLLAAKYLAYLRDKEFKGKSAVQLTKSDIEVIAARYNRGETETLEELLNSTHRREHGINLTNRWDDLTKLMSN